MGCLSTKSLFSGELTATVESSSGKSYVVNLENGTCTCGVWRDTLIPCSHAIAFIGKVPSKSVLSFLPHCYKVVNLKEFYASPIPMIDFEALKPGHCIAPQVKRKRGRPATARIPSAHEGTRKKPRRCQQCDGSGHNIRSCPLTQSFE